MQRKRSQWIETISGANAEHQIYLDESGINTNLTRHYAHAVHGKRAMDATPINTPAGTTVLSSIRLNGSLVYTTYQGGTTAQRFREYMGKQLIPSLEKGDVVDFLDAEGCYFCKATVVGVRDDNALVELEMMPQKTIIVRRSDLLKLVRKNK